MIGLSAASVRSSQSPRSPGVLRPIASTAVASMQSMPAPDNAMVPKWIMCHGVAAPSFATYWHIGDTTTRLGKVMPRRLNGENKTLTRPPEQVDVHRRSPLIVDSTTKKGGFT